MQIEFVNTAFTGIATGAVALLLTVAVDSIFWQRCFICCPLFLFKSDLPMVLSVAINHYAVYLLPYLFFVLHLLPSFPLLRLD